MMDKRLLPAFALFFILSVWIALRSPAYALTLEPVPNELAEIVSSEALEDLEQEENQAGQLLPIEPMEDNSPSQVVTPQDIEPIYRELRALRQNSDLFLFGLFPISCAVSLVAILCVWFYRTFIKIAL